MSWEQYSYMTPPNLFQGVCCKVEAYIHVCRKYFPARDGVFAFEGRKRSRQRRSGRRTRYTNTSNVLHAS